jgi:hypothetical protein
LKVEGLIEEGADIPGELTVNRGAAPGAAILADNLFARFFFRD